MAGIFWHNLPIGEVDKILKTNLDRGLEENEIKLRQGESGKNELPEEKPLPRLRIFLEQFRSPLIYILVIAGIITLLLKEWADTIVIFGAVFLNVVVGFFQENKASRTLSALKKVVEQTAAVLRGGNLKIIDAKELVPGDVIILNPGDKVPADGRITECQDFKTNEMALTGEWLAANKNPGVLAKETPLADRDNMIYMGTIVENGKAKVVVVETGLGTQIGKVAELVKETKEEKTPYQIKLTRFSKIIGIIIGLISFGIFIEGIMTGKEFTEMFIVAIAVAVAAIPEGLPVSMTVILSLGMQRILKKKGLVRKLVSTETLGSTSIICTDKTATLTEGKMRVEKVLGDKLFTLKACTLTSDAFIENPEDPEEKWILRGRPTDRALLFAGLKAGIEKNEKNKLAELPFNPINKFAAVIFKEKEVKILYACGAPEKILQICTLTKEKREKLKKQLDNLTRKGLRVVASAYKKIKSQKILTNLSESSETKNLEDELQELIFAGFITLKDPIRPEVKESMKICRQAGIKPIIVTGDHKLTAKAVAEELGFRIKKENILTGIELDKLSDQEFERVLSKIQIYARVEPRHKMRIVESWQKKGEVVAMTGDGINDAPALKKADIGIAVGSGTEVAKEASDLILLNDSFSIIVAAVEEGRAILDNIRKVITYLLVDSFDEVVLIGGSILAGFPLPLTAVQILWTNLIEDGLPDIALAFEPKEKDLMKRKPGGRDIPLLTKEMKALIFIIGIIEDFFLLALFFWLFNRYGLAQINYIRTMMFAGLAMDTLYGAFACKSLRQNLWHMDLLSNKLLVISIIFGGLMLMGAIYFPPFQRLLKTVPLEHNDWLILGIISIIQIFLVEITKWYFIVKKEV